jgi:hypothetical protein
MLDKETIILMILKGQCKRSHGQIANCLANPSIGCPVAQPHPNSGQKKLDIAFFSQY